MDRLSMSLFDAAVNLNPHQIEAALFALQTIKEIEQRLGDASVRLQSFIVSNTPSHTMKQLWNMDKPAMVARHILPLRPLQLTCEPRRRTRRMSPYPHNIDTHSRPI
jgi:hypothetical protein